MSAYFSQEAYISIDQIVLGRGGWIDPNEQAPTYLQQASPRSKVCINKLHVCVICSGFQLIVFIWYRRTGREPTLKLR